MPVHINLKIPLCFMSKKNVKAASWIKEIEKRIVHQSKSDSFDLLWISLNFYMFSKNMY